MSQALQANKEVKRASCFFCHHQCGVLADVENGRITGIRPDEEHLISRGRMCIKGTRGVEFHYHKDRLNYPLKRIGGRGEGKWQKVSWDQALDEVAAKLKEIKDRYGPEALAGSRGTYRTHQYFMTRFFNLFGSPNRFGPGTICFCNTWAINNATYGTFALPVRTPASRCVVFWGYNPAESYPPIWRGTLDLKKKGARFITIDPRFTPAARESDIWLRLRPCTDGALALGWLNVIIEEGLYDKEFVEKWTVGFDKLGERVREYTPERVAQITWVEADKIRESARLYATTRPAVITYGVKPDQIGLNATQTIRAQCILRAITGNLDVEGGESLGGVGDKIRKIVPDMEMELNEKLPPEQRRKQLGSDRFRLLSYPGFELITKCQEGCAYLLPVSATRESLAHEPTVWRAILTGEPYPVKALISQSNNPLLQATNTRQVYQALKALELLVVMDYFMTPTAVLADYVFPAADWMERPVLPTIAGNRNNVFVGEKAVEPEFERREDYLLWRGLGLRLGQQEYWPWKSLEEALDYRLSRLGYTVKDFVQNVRGIKAPPENRKYEKYGFATPSGKVELYSSIFEKLGYDPLPYYEEPPDSPVSDPKLAREYPLILTTGGRIKYFYHSEHRQIQSLRRLHPDPIIQIHPETAGKLGISDGDWVWIETPLGRVQQRANLDAHIDPRVVHAEHSWWFPEEAAEEPSLHGLWKSNINVLIDNDPDKCDPVVGGWPHMTMCRVSKVNR